MGLSASTPEEPASDPARVTLYYASYGEDIVWQAFADIERHEGVHVTLVDIAKNPEAARSEGISEFPTLVCVSGAGIRAVYRYPDDIVSCYARWVKNERARIAHMPQPDALD